VTAAPHGPLLQVLDDQSTPSSGLELSEQQEKQIKEIFDLFDTDGGGSIDPKELDAAMFALGFHPSSSPERHSQSVKAASVDMDRFDLDGSRTITLDEFSKMMKGEVAGKGPLEEIWAAFSSLSRADVQHATQTAEGGWGVVTLGGLKRACKEYDVKLSDEELHAMMEEVDRDKNKWISRDEFMAVMSNAPWF
jgi:Ca2+-binding EF-hand superfamily protein